MGRTLVLTPILFVTIAQGIVHISKYLQDQLVRRSFIAAICLCIAALNLIPFFTSYPDQLPNENAPIGRIIMEEMKQLPAGKKVIIEGCCWTYDQPEPKSIQYRFNEESPNRQVIFDEEQRIFAGTMYPEEGHYLLTAPNILPPEFLAPKLQLEIQNRYFNIYRIK